MSWEDRHNNRMDKEKKKVTNKGVKDKVKIKTVSYTKKTKLRIHPSGTQYEGRPAEVREKNPRIVDRLIA